MGTKSIKPSAESDSGVIVSDTTVRMNVNKDNGIMVDERGTTITGPISIVSATNHIRVGGLWTFNNPMNLSLPSTLATPTPVLMVDPPMKQFVNLMKDATVMLALTGSLVAVGANG